MKQHFTKYWKQYLIGVVVIFAFYKAGQHYGWFRKKSTGGSPEDVINAGLAYLPILPELDYNKQISLNDNDEYSKALIQYFNTLDYYVGSLDVWRVDNTIFTQNLLDYIMHFLPAYNLANPTKPIYVVQSINLSDAIKLIVHINQN